MKIGIMTFWSSQDNYGQLLQAYALQTYLTNLGHDVFQIAYNGIEDSKGEKSLVDKIKQLNYSKIISIIKQRQNKKKTLAEQREHPRYFDKFRADYLHIGNVKYKTYQSLVSNPPEADFYICGSDQVWNYSFIGKPEPYFLQFGDLKVKRLSYAASFGHKDLPEDIQAKVQSFLQKFDSISVREKSGVDICKKLVNKDIHWVPDPTLLITKEQWSALSADTNGFKSENKQKVFVYTLGNRPLEAKDEILKYFSEIDNTELVHSSINNDFSGTSYPTINEWLGLFKNTDLVLTNSFHGIVFSIIFNKKFFALPSKGSTAGMNERILSLLQKCGLEDHILFEFNKDEIQGLIAKEVDWAKVNKTIAEWRLDANAFLNLSQYV